MHVHSPSQRPAGLFGVTDPRIRQGVALVAAIWLTALLARGIGSIVQATGPAFRIELTAWPSLVLYVLGTLALALWLRRTGGWSALGFSTSMLRRSLAWGVGIGVVLMLLDWFNTYQYYRAGNPPMAEMEQLLVQMRLIYLFPLLTLAEEILWRGILALGLVDAGMNPHLAVALTTVAYAVNHFFVAPVGLTEQALMTMMALPIGIVGGYITVKTRNLSGSLALHLLTVVSMIVDIYWMPIVAAA